MEQQPSSQFHKQNNPIISPISQQSLGHTKIQHSPLQKPLDQILDIYSNSKTIVSPISLYEISKEQAKSVQRIVVIKEREQGHDYTIDREWKYKKINFPHQIQQRFDELKQFKKLRLTERNKKMASILKLFQHSKSYSQELDLDLNYLGELSQYKNQIKQLKQSYESFYFDYNRRRMECPPIIQIIHLKLTSLRVIHIEYELKKSLYCYNQNRYSISSFQLFQVVHHNQSLQQATIKGVLVEEFQQFIELLNCLGKGESQKQRQGSAWMKSFKPPKTLKLAISARISFYTYQQEKALSLANNILFFVGLFEHISDLKVRIDLSNWNNLSLLQNIWSCIKTLKRIDIEMWGQYKQYQEYIDICYVPNVRSMIFGGLTSLTEIAQLSFSTIGFGPQVNPSDFLAMEKSLSTLFENNKITHLKLQRCNNFPIFPEIRGLQLIQLRDLSFHKEFDFLGEIIKRNENIKVVMNTYNNQRYSIDEKLFNQLQALVLNNCDGVTLSPHFEPKTPSNMRYLSIYQQTIGNIGPVLFPKLAHLVSLQIRGNFGHQLLCSIPSPHLQRLSITQNNVITDHGVQEIDSHWIGLKYIQMKNCRNVTDKAWSACKFKALMDINVDKVMLGKGGKALHDFKSKGIRASLF